MPSFTYFWQNRPEFGHSSYELGSIKHFAAPLSLRVAQGRARGDGRMRPSLHRLGCPAISARELITFVLRVLPLIGWVAPLLYYDQG